MAPTTSASTSKRPRPSFSPPRPGRSKVQKTTKEKSANGNPKARKSLDGEGSARVQKSGPSTAKAKAKAKPGFTGKEKPLKKGKKKEKQRGAGGTMRAILDETSDEDEDRENGMEEGGDDNPRREAAVSKGFGARMDTDLVDSTVEHSDDEDEDNQDVSNNSDQEDNNHDNNNNTHDSDEEVASLPSSFSSPEPDFILAEISHPHPPVNTSKSKSSTSSDDAAIPLPLIHRIMHTHFTRPQATSISPTARQLLGRYVEVFVKEAVRRCVDEKKERVQAGGEGDDTGWLEVEDLERVGGQLVMDF